MKKTLFILLSVGLILFTTAAIIDFKSDSGLSQSTYSSIFVTCKATCKGTHIYSRASLEGTSYFPQCQCDGLLKEEVKEITYNSAQEENLNQFIDFVDQLPVDAKIELTATLKVIKTAIEADDYQGYEQGITKYLEYTNQMEKEDLQLLDDWIENNSEVL
tara:strand:+ start:3137 stop:3616 length:480 start_codon:yes stop_codon:yes gene_type:complete